MRTTPIYEFVRFVEVRVFEGILEFSFTREVDSILTSVHIWGPLSVEGKLCLENAPENPHECLEHGGLEHLRLTTRALMKMDPENWGGAESDLSRNYGYWQPSLNRTELKTCLVLQLSKETSLSDFLVNFCVETMGRVESFREEIKFGEDLAVNVLNDRIRSKIGLDE